MRALLAFYDAGPEEAATSSRRVLAKTGTAAEVAAKKQDNLKGKLENLQGSIETAAIAIGTRMLPTLTQAAEDITKIINDPKLTDAKKFELLAKKAGEAFEAAIPIIATRRRRRLRLLRRRSSTGSLAAGVWGRSGYRRVLAFEDGWPAGVHEGRGDGWCGDGCRHGMPGSRSRG